MAADNRMEWVAVVAALVIFCGIVQSQTNTFPTSGNAGVGTTSPASTLSIGGSGTSGVGLYVNGSTPNAVMQLQSNGSSIWSLGVGDSSGTFFTLGSDTPNALNILKVNGYVGIGTKSPDAVLDSVGTDRFELTSSSITSSFLMNAGNINDVLRINAPYSANPASGSNAGAAWGIRFIGTTSGADNRNSTTKGPAIFAVSEDPGSGYNRANGLALYTNMLDSPAVERMRISNTGNVGIGTTSPGATLEVNGALKLTLGSGASITFADGTVQSTAYTGVSCGGDFAESVNVIGNRHGYEPGDLLVIDPDHPGDVLKSAGAYSTSVAGIYSTKPGYVGRRQTTAKSPDEVPMAIMGIVPTKVSAENGLIHPGDLLVTASVSGYAMKGTDRSRMLGAVVGKAMGSLQSGTGVIEVLVTLQ